MITVIIIVSCRRGGGCFAVRRRKLDDMIAPFWELNGNVGVASVRMNDIDVAHTRGGC